jgi:hypothetical protein
MAANKVGEWEFSEEEILRDIEEATKRGEESLRNEPQAESVKFDKDNNLIMLYLTNGCVFGFPPDLIKELRAAKPAEIAQAELTSLGTGVFWENLDADYTVSGLLNGVFGTKVWMKELGRKGGSVKSAAKREAAKINGAKGGRPRKDIGMHHFQVSLPKTDYLSSLNSTKNYLPFRASVTTLNAVPVGKLEETKEYIEEPISHKNKHIIEAKILSFRTKTETNLTIKNIKVSKLEEEYAGESIAA